MFKMVLHVTSADYPHHLQRLYKILQVPYKTIFKMVHRVTSADYPHQLQLLYKTSTIVVKDDSKYHIKRNVIW